MKRIPLKRIALVLGGIALLAVAAIAVFIASEWTYLSRMWGHPANSILGVAWYQPKEAVPGVEHPVPLPVADGLSTEAFAEAVRLAEAKNAAALLVVYEGRLVLERHWNGYRPGDWTNSASMAKTVTALLSGVAVGEGKIASIDEPASRWIPSWRGDARSRITLRHLLQMHAGLRPMGEYEEPYSDASYLALGTDARYVVDNVPAEAEPGRRFDYNNVNFQALGVVLEAATGRRYADYLSEKLWKPIGAGEAALWLDRDGGSARTFGYLFARPEDWARLGLLLLHEGECEGRPVVPKTFLREMLKPSPTEPTYGLGIWLANDEHQRREQEALFAVPGIFYLDGRFKQRVYVVPSRELVIVRVGENARGWDEAALPNAVLKGLERFTLSGRTTSRDSPGSGRPSLSSRPSGAASAAT
jgi:CubicO group peptidase (beta-lactamase class C family)